MNVEHHVLPGLHVSFLYNQGGALVKWFRNTFASADVPPEGANIYDIINREIPAPPTSLLALPHFMPPVWPRQINDSGGVILGLTTGTTRGEILKSIMEGETFYFVDSLRALKEVGVDTTEFIATGGGAKSDVWLQIKADILGVPFVRLRISEGSLLGAAMLAGLAAGVFKSPVEAVQVCVEHDRRFEPDTRRHALYKEKFKLFQELFPSTQGLLRKLRTQTPGSV